MAEIQTPRLLIVDDEVAQMEALCSTLRDEGYVTVGFTSANEALTALRHEGFDLLLTDLMMPEMDGIHLLRAALEFDANLVGIMMTGHGTIDSAVGAMKSGALDYILKPFKLTAILPVLSRALTVRRLRSEKEALERRVRERTTALEAANRELEAFAYSVSHDLRAPLRHIDAYTRMVLEEHSSQLSTEAQGFLTTVATKAQHMGRLIEDLLHFSELGRRPLAKQRVNVAAVVQEVLEELRKDQGHRRVDIQVGPLPECMGDPALLKQVFVNLLSNAFKFTRLREKAVIEVGFQRKEERQFYFIRDNGAGFDKRYADKLFGVFQRLHSADQFEGTGVGLSIVHRILQRHGGQVWAEAEVDKGATFYFSLPG